jgi:hypothetical protein
MQGAGRFELFRNRRDEPCKACLCARRCDIEGGEGSDSFVFKDRWGDDAIIDFADDHDAIQLDAAAYAQLDQALENAVQNGADAVLTFDGGIITLANTNIANITHDDFRLAG